MLPIRPTARFKKDLKRAGRQGRNLTKLRDDLETLAIPKALPPEFRDHKLKGEWRDFRECHVEPDSLLTEFELRPARVGSHAELFE